MNRRDTEILLARNTKIIIIIGHQNYQNYTQKLFFFPKKQNKLQHQNNTNDHLKF